MDLESPWSDFYDLLLQDESSHSETEDEWTSVQKTARGHIECQSLSTTMDDATPVDPEFQTFVNQVLATISSSPPPSAQRHYHFHHHNHRLNAKLSSSSWSQTARSCSSTSSGESYNSDQKKNHALMPGTFIDDPALRKIQCSCEINKSMSKRPATTTSTTLLMDVHAWITSIAFFVHLLLLWFRP